MILLQYCIVLLITVQQNAMAVLYLKYLIYDSSVNQIILNPLYILQFDIFSNFPLIRLVLFICLFRFLVPAWKYSGLCAQRSLQVFRGPYVVLGIKLGSHIRQVPAALPYLSARILVLSINPKWKQRSRKVQ